MRTIGVGVGVALVLVLGCSDQSGNNGPSCQGSCGGDGGMMTGPGGPPTRPPFGNITLPWPVFDGTVPDTPESSTGHTYYVDANAGDDSHDGKSFASAKKTISAALKISGLAAGDTILIGGGIYREYPTWTNAPGGTATAPFTIGSYGRGTGRPIIDGGIVPKTWTKYTAQGQTTVWMSSTAGLTNITSKMPVLGIYVSSGSTEAALGEVIHGQVTAYPGDSLPPNQTQADIKDNSNEWYYDATGQTVYADFGGTLGTSDPNQADVSLLFNSENGPSGHKGLLYLDSTHGNFRFVGLAFRASSWDAVYIESSGNTLDHCDIKFNGGAGVVFASTNSAAASTGNTATLSRIWMNVLANWPRFNNGYTGGGWPGGITWYSESNGLALGNLVYQNGGEGMIFYGTASASYTSQNNQVQHNVIFDNFSVNLYLDNTTNNTVEQNFLFDHPRNPAQTFPTLLTVSKGYNTDFGRRLIPVSIGLADEPGSAYDSNAHLANITVVNNIIAGGTFGIVDYDDGTANKGHGLKNCVIANNTLVLGRPDSAFSSFLWQHSPPSSTDPSTGTLFQNNVFVTNTASDDSFITLPSTPATGIDLNYNAYGGPGNWSNGGKSLAFTTWQAARTGWDVNSMAVDPMLIDTSEFSKAPADEPVYDWSKAGPAAGSPVIGAGTALKSVTTDFTGKTRSGSGIGALAQ